MITKINGDAWSELVCLAGNQFDLILTSPPYWSARRYGGDTREIGKEKRVDDYLLGLERILTRACVLLKPTGSLVVNVGDRYRDGCLQMIPARVAEALISGPHALILRNHLIWQKPNCKPEPVKNRFTSSWESVLWFTKKKSGYFFKQQFEPFVGGWGGKNNGQGYKGRSTKDHAEQGSENASTIKARICAGAFDPRGKNMRDVWKIPHTVSRGGHTAVFPVELCRRVISALCPVGGTVLDPFAGEGTVGSVAESLGRDSVIIELYEKW